MPVPMIMLSYMGLFATYHSRPATTVALVLLSALGFGTLACSTGERSTSTRHIALWLGGDVHVGAHTKPLLRPLQPYLRGAHGIVNLEGPVISGQTAAAAEAARSSTAQRLLNSAAALPWLAASGVRVAGVRNNHDTDLGTGGLADTRAALRAANIAPAGADPGFIDSAGVRVAVVAHDLSSAHERHTLGSLRADIERSIAAASARADLVVASFHIRGPPSYLPPQELVEAVDTALSAGALIVAAHGSHALARVERRGPAIIAWGLGNLLFDCACTSESDGLIVYLSISVIGPVEARRVRIDTAQVIAIDAGLLGAPATPASDGALTLDLLRSLGSQLHDRDDVQAQFLA